MSVKGWVMYLDTDADTLFADMDKTWTDSAGEVDF